MTARVRKAVIELLITESTDQCTFKAVAERAGVERSTLYRRYPDRWDMIVDAFMAIAEAEILPELGNSFAGDLSDVLAKLVETLETPLGPALLSTVAALRNSHGSNYTRAYFDRRVVQLGPMFDAAIARGELRTDVDREAIFIAAAGPIYFRIFIAGRGADAEFIRSVVSQICWHYCTPSAAAKFSVPARMT